MKSKIIIYKKAKLAKKMTNKWALTPVRPCTRPK